MNNPTPMELQTDTRNHLDVKVHHLSADFHSSSFTIAPQLFRFCLQSFSIRHQCCTILVAQSVPRASQSACRVSQSQFHNPSPRVSQSACRVAQSQFHNPSPEFHNPPAEFHNLSFTIRPQSFTICLQSFTIRL